MRKGCLVAFVACCFATAAHAQDTWSFNQFAVGSGASGGGSDSSLSVMMPDIVRLSNGTYRMYYGASGTPGLTPGAMTCIRSATSSDGLTWTVESGFRLVGDSGDGNPGTDSIPTNEGILSGPRVVQLSNGTYRMYYQASTQGMSPPDFRVKSATSADGLTWTREGTRIDIDPSNPNPAAFSLAGHSYIIRFADNDYVIFISANYQKSTAQPSDLVIGTSADGLTFGNFSVLYLNGHDPFVLRLNDGSGYRLFFGNLLERQRSVVSADGKTWPAYSQTSETILQNSSGTEVTEASTEAPGDRAALQLSSGEILLYMNWGNPSGNIALLRPVTSTSSSSGGGGGGGGGGCGSIGLDVMIFLLLPWAIKRWTKHRSRLQG